MSGKSYISEIDSITKSLRQYSKSSKELRKQKALAIERLYHWMKNHQLEEYEGYKLEKIAPKPKNLRKKAKEKREDALRLFSEVGINDPEEFWEAFQRTQKPAPPEEDS